jgi:hypothetical protein
LMQILHVSVLSTMRDYQKNIASLFKHNEGLYYDAGIVNNSLFFILAIFVFLMFVID